MKIVARMLVSLVALAGLASAANAGVATLTLIPSADTTLSERVPDNSLGGHDRILSGIDGAGASRRGLYLFDFAGSLPPNAVIDSATLTLSVNMSNTNVGDYSLHRMLVDWTEGKGLGSQGEPASRGDSTWNSRHFPDVAWAAPGGRPDADYVAKPSATTMVGNAGEYDWKGLAADVHTMLNPCENFGWMFIRDEEEMTFTARQFESRESSLEIFPALEIQYHLPITGDVNFDGSVDRTDAARLALNFGATECMTWSQGDLDGDGAVTLTDWGILQSSLPGGMQNALAVPEPSTGMIALFVGSLAAWRFLRKKAASVHRSDL